jgi:hypothetical protein
MRQSRRQRREAAVTHWTTALRFFYTRDETVPGERGLDATIFAGNPEIDPPTDICSVRIHFEAPNMQVHVYGVTYGYTNVDHEAQVAHNLSGPVWRAKPFSEFEEQLKTCFPFTS